MRKIHYLNFLLLINTVSSCQNKTNIVEKSATKEKAECVVLYDKYVEKFSARENDSALYYIDRYIECDPSKTDNKYTKVQLLISMRNYKNAILVFSDLKLDDPALKMQKGVLMLKIKDTNAESVLKESFEEFCKIKEPTSSNQFYKIALDNYFKGKEYALKEIDKFKIIYKNKDYETQNITALEVLIKNENKENVLFKAFNIRE